MPPTTRPNSAMTTYKGCFEQESASKVLAEGPEADAYERENEDEEDEERKKDNKDKNDAFLYRRLDIQII